MKPLFQALALALLLPVAAFTALPGPPRQGRVGSGGGTTTNARTYKTWDEAKKAVTTADSAYKAKVSDYMKIHRELEDARTAMTNDPVDRANKVRELEGKVESAKRAQDTAKRVWQECATGARDWANANGDQIQKNTAAGWVTSAFGQ